MFIKTGNIIVTKHDLPGGRLLSARDEIHRRGLAGAIRSDQQRSSPGSTEKSKWSTTLKEFGKIW